MHIIINRYELEKFLIKTKPLATRLTLDASSARDVKYKITVLQSMTEIRSKLAFLGEILIFLCLIQAVNWVLTDLRLLAEAFQTAAQTDWVCPGCVLLLRQTSLQKSRWNHPPTRTRRQRGFLQQTEVYRRA